MKKEKTNGPSAKQTSIAIKRFAAALIILSILLMSMPGAAQAVVAELTASPAKIQADLNKLNQAKADLSSQGIGYTRTLDLVSEAQLSYNYGNYKAAGAKIQEVYDLIDIAKTAKSDITDTKTKYEALTKNQPTLDLLESIGSRISKAENEFQNENFEEATIEISAAKDKIILAVNEKYSQIINDSMILTKAAKNAGLNDFFSSRLEEQARTSLESGDSALIEFTNQSIQISMHVIETTDELKQNMASPESGMIDTQRITDLMLLSKEYLENSQFELAMERIDEAQSASNKAAQLVLRIGQAQKDSAKLLANPISAEFCDENCAAQISSQLQAAQEETIYGNYEKAESELIRTENAIAEIDTKISIELIQRQKPDAKIKAWIYKNKMLISIILAAMAALILAFRKPLAAGVRKAQLTRTRRELDVNERILRDRQKDYYIARRISRESYDEAYNSLQESIFTLKEKIARLEKK